MDEAVPTSATPGPARATPGQAGGALRVLLLGAALGLVGQLLLFDVGLGVNFPILIALLVALAWTAAAPAGRRLRLVDAWLPVAAVGFAIPVALRGDPTLVALDVLGSLGLAGTSIAVFGGLRVVDRPLAGLLALAGRLTAAAGGGANRAVGRVVRGRPWATPRRATRTPWGGVLRGLVIAVPVVLVFVGLFSAADAVFARWVERLTAWDLDLGGAIGRTVMAAVIAWLAAGLLAFAVDPGSSTLERDGIAAWARRPRIGAVEVVTVLVALDVVFAAFVLLQAAYLFGGLDTLAETGLTHAEYARRGFFELLAVAVLVGGLLLTAEALIRDRTAAYRAALVGLVLLTLVVLASAFLRLSLYQEAFGWTELRFYATAAIVWLAIGAALAVVTVLTSRSAWLVHGLLALSIGFGIAFNAIGPVRFVAEQNVARIRDMGDTAPSGAINLDLAYLVSLGSDAAPIVIESLADRPLPPAVAERIYNDLATASGLDDPRNATWQAWNLSRERARSLLER